MTAYRTDEDAARLLVADLERETAEVYRENLALATRLDRTEAALEGTLRRLAEAGAGAGRASAGRDRVALGAWLLLGASLALVPIQRALVATADVAALPILALFAAPALLAALIAHPSRNRSRACRWAWALALGVVLMFPLELMGVSWR